ncbi:unnamed protein product [Candidula unifasciata]|uniref:Uncharacterized protein n=1 Tax=Candidula unifasciata TaxID=100452 RepID=A0A8S4A1U5_9EUPU|nr:unnamed protein product [Candidula unifasciata]
MPGREKIEMAPRAMSKIENLNAIVPRTVKLKPKGRITPDIRVHSVMNADYSSIYKENVILEENLEDRLSYIKKNERRALEEKGEELDEMRRQMDVISKLQEAVNSRNPADSLDVLSANKAVRWLNDNKKSRAQLKIEAEREKFSSRNLFNVRRFHTGFDFLHRRKLVPPSAMQVASDNKDEGNVDDLLKTESPKPERPPQTKGYLKQTFSSTSGLRPMTATITYQREQKEDDILPLRSKSAVLRSRSRRQLELLVSSDSQRG